jgi:hypothetical protein
MGTRCDHQSAEMPGVCVTLEAVPAQLGDLELFASHGLYGIPEDCLHVSDFDEHINQV